MKVLPKGHVPGPLLSSFHYFSVLPKNFKVKMVTKTSVLLSWEFPENYNSVMPYKVRAEGDCSVIASDCRWMG